MPARTFPRGLALRGHLRPESDGPTVPDGVVLLGPDGRVAALGPVSALPVPPDLPVIGGPAAVVMPGLVDAHVHLAFPDPDSGPGQMLAGGVVAVRDLGAPPELAERWRTPPGSTAAPTVAVAGPLLTADGGYPSQTWGAAGFTLALSEPRAAERVVAAVAAAGVDLIKLALEPAGGQPVPSLAVARAAVAAAHRRGLAVTCHALTKRHGRPGS